MIAISGLHIGLIAGLAFLIARWLWLRFGSLRIPAPSVSAGFAILCATGYSALAGFSLPTQRSMIMIGLVMGAILLRRKVVLNHTLALALFLILLYDPTAVLAPGLWLSFCAVFVIAYTMSGRIGPGGRWTAMRTIQLATALGLAPLTLLYFQQVSLIAPVANVVAVPVVSFLVVPACLVATIGLPIGLEAAIGLLQIAVYVLELLWRFLEWLARLPFAQWSGSEPTLASLLLAVPGLLLLFAPRGIPARWLGVVMLLPMLFADIKPPNPGEVQFTLLDVDQGLAAVVETTHHTLVFDTGARFGDHFDMGTAVVAPFLRKRNIRSIDRLVISHADNDHSGGARPLDGLIPITDVYTSVPEAIDWRKAHACKAGQNWTWDGVEFLMLAPFAIDSARENDNSCVLRIQSRSGSFLLTGDIEKATESALVVRYGQSLQSDYLVVPHHGSNTSSTSDFLDAVRPKYALIPAGYRNRYGFPRPQVIARLERVGAELYNSADSGAILVTPANPDSNGKPIRYRIEARKYY
ncbi:MAG: DNA internalization-related competence protein ComEC/Rec2, partial [Methylococcales bacterium]